MYECDHSRIRSALKHICHRRFYNSLKQEWQKLYIFSVISLAVEMTRRLTSFSERSWPHGFGQSGVTASVLRINCCWSSDVHFNICYVARKPLPSRIIKKSFKYCFFMRKWNFPGSGLLKGRIEHFWEAHSNAHTNTNAKCIHPKPIVKYV